MINIHVCEFTIWFCKEQCFPILAIEVLDRVRDNYELNTFNGLQLVNTWLFEVYNGALWKENEIINVL